MVLPPGPSGTSPRKKSARQPRSTQMPCRSYPQVCPWVQGEPLRWLVICTPRLVSTRHKCLLPSSEAQVTLRPFCAVIPLCAQVFVDPKQAKPANSKNSPKAFFIFALLSELADCLQSPLLIIGASEGLATL